MKEIRIIFRFFANSLQQLMMTPGIFVVFLLSKLLRYGLFTVFLFFLVSGVGDLGGYSRSQIIFFYLSFNLIDTTAQILFREVYRFRPLVVSGGFDLVLTKPFHPLLRSLLGGPDFIDLGMLVIILGVIIYLLAVFIRPDPASVVVFSLLVVNSLLLATAFHIIVLGIGILTFSVDHLIMVYRDLTSLVRLPVDVYAQPLRAVITFVIPLGIMFSFPSKALFGLLSWRLVGISFGIGVSTFVLAVKFWDFALKHYQSASS